MFQQKHNLTIEKIQHHDLDDLEKIFTAAFGEELDAGRIRQRIHRIRQFYYLLLPLSGLSPWVRNMFNIFICRVNHTVAGFVQVSCINPQQMHLDYIALSKQYRGQGLGTLILRRLLTKVAQRNYDIVLEVRTGNPAYNLYKRLGFAEQAQIIHYEKTIDDTATLTAPAALPGLRPSRAQDWLQLYQLYLHSLPAKLHRIVKRDRLEFKPNPLTAGLEYLKNRLMRTRKAQYVLTENASIIGSLEINSFLKTNSHIISIMLEPAAEHCREVLLKQALFQLQPYGAGTVSTTIYDDDLRKQLALEKVGFSRQEAYCLMFRPPSVEVHELSVHPPRKLRDVPKKQHLRPSTR